jgi:hypothetical protein
MYIFNPDNDLAIANFNHHFTAPASARKMRSDLALLPIWYAPDGALVIAEGELNNLFLEELKRKMLINNSLISLLQIAEHPNVEVKPWGWNPALRKELIQAGVNEQMLPSISDLELLRNYSGRQNAVKLLSELKALNPAFCGESYLYTDIERLLSYLKEANGDQVLKMPYSGSGKGLVWLKGAITDKQTDWCRRVLKMQGGVVAEPVLSKVQDFAMEFEMTDLGVQFVGYSLFQSASSGAYMGNVLLSDRAIEDKLSNYIERYLLVQLKATLKTKLCGYYPHYRGYLGVDMMICKTAESVFQLQPCVEINMRMNMGIVAHAVFERFVHSNSTGLFSINYFKREDEAQKYSLTLQKNNPIIIENGRIKSGYLALTSVDENTNYAAAISIKQNHEEN